MNFTPSGTVYRSSVFVTSVKVIYVRVSNVFHSPRAIPVYTGFFCFCFCQFLDDFYCFFCQFLRYFFHLLKWFLVEVHDHVGVHVEESPVRVVRESLVARGVDDALFCKKKHKNIPAQWVMPKRGRDGVRGVGGEGRCRGKGRGKGKIIVISEMNHKTLFFLLWTR